MENRQFKRTCRNLSPKTKEKISNSMKQYWKTVPPTPIANDQDFDSFIGNTENKDTNN